MKLCWKSLLIVSICVAMLPAVPASSAVIHRPYEGPAVLAYGGPSDCADPVRSMGIGCFAVPAGASKLELRVRDVTDLAIGGTYYLNDASGAHVASGSFCGAKTIPLAGAALAVVRLEAINGPLACAEAGGELAGLATQGVIAARLR